MSTTRTIRIPGREEPDSPAKKTRFITITDPHTYRISATRAAGDMAEHQSPPDEVVEIEFVDGTRIWTTRQRLCSELIPPQQRKRSADGAIELPAELPREGAARGIFGKILFKTLTFFGVDVAGRSATFIAQKWEEHTLGAADEGRGPALYRCATSGDFALYQLNRDWKPQADKPVLLFLHGTASSSRGSFGELWAPEKLDLRNKLFAPYGGNVLALEHRTLSTSPVQNALDLVRALHEALPPGARLHLVSHSRGGLVGELLCRVMVQGEREPFTSEELEWFRKKDPSGLRGNLSQLNELLRERRFRVERFVRVACPAWGTKLASNRLDIYLSILFNLLGKVPLSVPGVQIGYDILSELIMLVAKERTDPAVLPGIEAMIPGTPLVQLLNRPNCQVGGELRVIAGDIAGETALSALLAVAADPVFGTDNDLVVDTEAMFGGADRPAGAGYSFHQGPEVSHFRYFKNDESASRLLKALTREAQEVDGFKSFAVRQSDQAPPPYRGAAAGPRPVVLLLPDFMGSHLAAGNERIWLDPDNLALGKIEALHLDAPGVKALEPIWSCYGKLVAHLSTRCEVIPFAYDWRLSLKTEAARLAAELEKVLAEVEKAGLPVSIIAHGSGGLLARAVIGNHLPTWQRMVQHPQSRLIMLGTPNGGTLAAAQLLTGRGSVINQLALLDLKHDPAQLLNLISGYPGLLELLPAGGDGLDTPDPDHPTGLFDPAVWEALWKSDPRRDRWQVPPAKALREAATVRKDIALGTLDQRVIYLAGQGPVTPCRVEPGTDEDGNACLIFQATSRGDGRVPWDTGMAPGIADCYYIPAAHGDLPGHEESFAALDELLQKGSTDRLSKAAPATGGGRADIPLPEEPAQLYTGFNGLARAALGGAPHPKLQKTVRRVPVSLAHGSLRFTKNPVLLGHYQGDTLVSAEAYLDRILNGRLRARHDLGLYPGEEDTAEVFLNPEKQPGGAIVVGLGEVGKLSVGKLMRAVSRGVRSYALTIAESCVEDRPCTGIASVLVGTNAGGVSVEDSVLAILRGVAHALQSLEEQGLQDRVVLEELEFIELYEDRAIHAAHALDRALADPDIARYFWIDPALRVRNLNGGLRRAYFVEEDAWWQRLEITENRAGCLSFNVLTDRARAEVYLQQNQRSLADGFIGEIVSSADTTGDEIATTLFEMLVPNEIKENAPDRRDVVLVLNEEAARYPWEMMRERPRMNGLGKDGKISKPLSVQAGMIRQLQVKQFRDRVVMARGRAALVIGNPPTPFVGLPGAEREAEQVRQLLSASGYDCVPLIGKQASASAIMRALYATDYRIVHLAGHGVYQLATEIDMPCDCCGAATTVTTTTGVAIGKNQYLTPAQLAQMRAVPELVFVNCCHLGNIDGLPERPDFPKLAANIATQLIRMGVKAVVAAGWEVSDAPAELFATTFYSAMLSGVPFGEAVLSARKAIYDAFPKVNTWGAYQCYGDHAFRLSHSDGKGPASPKSRRFVAPAEVVSRLDNITQEAKTAVDERTARLRQELADCDQRIPSEWRRSGEILAALGRAYGELQDFAKGVAYYREALADEKALFPVKTIEQLSNLQARRAVELATASPPDPDAALQLIAQSQEHLEQLNELLGESAERLSLLGSSAKRKAMVVEGVEAKKASLTSMAECYLKAWRRGQERDPYPHTNALTAEVLLALLTPGGKVTPKARRAIAKERTAANERKTAHQDFWNSVLCCDCLLLEHLASRTLAKMVRNLVRDYLDVKSSLGSPREFRSVLEHLDFLIAMIAVAPEEVRKDLEAPLAEIRKELAAQSRYES